MNPAKLMEYEDIGEGKLVVRLNLEMLYGKGEESYKFDNNYAKYSELEENAGIVKEKGKDHLIYYSEQIIPQKRNDKPSVLLVFGNPASHSVISGMFFSYQGKNKEQEHRLWEALRKARIFEFDAENMVLNNTERNERRKKALFELTYATPFRIGLAVYYSMPSPASEKSWGGVSGLQRLFGKKALEKIWEAEKLRVNELISRFIKKDGAVITFQKDAWNGIKSKNDPHYCMAEMLEGNLMGKCACCEGVRLYCAPSTRNILSKKSIEILVNIKKSILNKDKI